MNKIDVSLLTDKQIEHYRNKGIEYLYNSKSFKTDINKAVYNYHYLKDRDFQEDILQEIILIILEKDYSIIADSFLNNKIRGYARMILNNIIKTKNTDDENKGKNKGSASGPFYRKYINKSKHGSTILESSHTFQYGINENGKYDGFNLIEDINLTNNSDSDYDIDLIKNHINDIFRDAKVFDVTDRFIYDLYYTDNKTYQQIEEIIKLSDSTIRYQLKEIMRHIISKLKEREIIN